MPWTVDFNESPDRRGDEIGRVRFTWTGDPSGDVVIEETLDLKRADSDATYRNAAKARLEAERDATIAKRTREATAETRMETFLNA